MLSVFSRLFRASLLLSGLAATSLAVASFTFTVIPHKSGADFVVVRGVSGDGKFVFGDTTTAGQSAGYQWSPQTSYVSIGPIPNLSITQGFAQAASYDGKTIVGEMVSSSNRDFAYRWKTNTYEIGGFPGNQGDASALGISEDGTVVAGFSAQALGSERAFHWTLAGGIVALDPAQGDSVSFAWGLSGDGKVVVGVSQPDNQHRHACYWDAANAVHVLATHGADVFSEAYRANKDGSVIVGHSGSDNSTNGACRWVNGVLQFLGKPGTEVYITPAGISDDGKAILFQGGNLGYLWTPQSGMLEFGKYLADHGVDLGGYTVGQVQGMSADGKTVVGNAHSLSDNNSGFIAHIDLPPAPIAIAYSPVSVPGGKPATGTLTLSGAPIANTVIKLSSPNTAIATVPPTVTVLAGHISATFPVTSYLVSATKHLSITGSLNLASVAGTITVTPPALYAITLSSHDVVHGTNPSGHVYLDTNAPSAGIMVHLSSDSAAVTVPSTVTVMGGSYNASFVATTHTVATATTAHITATYGAVSKVTTLTVR